MNKKRKILICPLNWGLGHASRIVPIIQLLKKNNHEIILGAYDESSEFLKIEFPELNIIELKGLIIRYSKSNSQILRMFFLIPKLFYMTFIEHQLLKKIVKKYEIDTVISDNRFGLWNKYTYNIFITHQLKVKFPGILKCCEFIYSLILKKIINKYNECWIPDYEGDNNLSGELSHLKKLNKNVFFIGPLSRFQEIGDRENKEEGILFILSGPEPQRTIFENIVLSQNFRNIKVTVVRGTNKPLNIKYSFPIYDIVNTSRLKKLIDRSDMVICRSGYSSIMDLIALRKKAVLIPTPGQTEQEYLAKYLKEKELFYSVTQEKFDIKRVIENCFSRPSYKSRPGNLLLERIKLLDKQNN